MKQWNFNIYQPSRFELVAKGIFPVFPSLSSSSNASWTKTIVIFNKSYPGEASERSNSIIEQVDFLSISLLPVSSKDRDCSWSSVRIVYCYRRHLENFGANLIWKWGCALGQVSWPLCLFIFAFFAGSVRSLGRSWMNMIAEKKTHRKKHGMDFSAVWIIIHLKPCQS